MRRSGVSASAERLSEYLLHGVLDREIGLELREWLSGSARFRSFTDAHRDKIRKKLRSAADTDALRDVRAELRVAHLLLGDRGIDLEFEAAGSTRGGPDFTVRYRGERPFTCEVTRLRRPPGEVRDGGPLLTKLRQLPPGTPNLLLIATGGMSAGALDVDAAVRAVRHRADEKDETYFVARSFAGTRDFYARFLRLGGVAVWCEAADGTERAHLWSNPSARIPLPQRAERAVVRALTDEAGP